MDAWNARTLLGFYQNVLREQILPFWLPRCLDAEHGGFYNCFDNTGKTLVSRDKYTWSQGRFVWIWAKLSVMQGNTFTKREKQTFLQLAESGSAFLRQHCLMGNDDWRCVFLMDETGAPKRPTGFDQLDASIYADCFAAASFAQYACAAQDRDAWVFCRRLYDSIWERVRSGRFHTMPYPLSPEYRAHGIPMILTNLCCEVYRAAQRFEPERCSQLCAQMRGSCTDVLEHFTDADDILHEVITQDQQFIDSLLGQHINPGHILEDLWFMLDAMELLNDRTLVPRVAHIAKKTFQLGWDTQWGGLFHFAGVNGWHPSNESHLENEPAAQLVRSDWDSKLWWVHAEALYSSLRLYLETGDETFWQMHRTVGEYTFRTFPNPDSELREWIQIRDRRGRPMDKVVALPVKDPYHITRSLILMIEALQAALLNNGQTEK